MKPQIRKDNLIKDIVAGIIVALVSIPISMGYAQVAGLPAVYGLYGSVFPILLYGLLTSSPQLIFGVDATPAALVGGALASFGIASGSEEAMELVPIISIATACWLLVFYFVKAGKLVNYISKPVMGGFISGIGCTIILMQLPKLFGGSAGTGELVALIINICEQTKNFNWLSLGLGLGTVVVILLFKKWFPKFPMSVVMLVAGACLGIFLDLERYGVALLPKVEGGLPSIHLPKIDVLMEYGEDIVMLSFTIALVIVAQTLLTANNYAMKYNYKIENNREVLAYAVGNAAGALVGCCPINGSVSRTGIADQYGGKSQVMSITASLTMVLVLLFGTNLLSYLPVPVLTGIVIAALIGIIEFGVAKTTWQSDKNEFLIFMAAFLGVLLLGTIYGVIIGTMLSFVAVIIRAVVPPKAFLGVIPGHEDFYTLKRNRNAKPIQQTIIYRFSGNLFFGNINTFQQDIENAIEADTKQVIVDARGIGNIDMTAAERLLILNRNLCEKGIHFYITEHVGTVNDQLRMYGAGSLIEEGVVRRTISLALRAAGVTKPYPLVGVENDTVYEYVEANERLAEFEWAFGEGAEEKMEQLATEVADKLVHTKDHSMESIMEAEHDVSWGSMGLFDEDELLERLEFHLTELEEQGYDDIEEIEERIEQRRRIIEKKINHLSPEALEILKRHREEIEAHLKAQHPEYYQRMVEIREHMAKANKE
ncbi:MAG: SulP family inorganic anion transporter [Lachnospiraceae bacterium]|nr:SulP family inorganic anion transporter [Lachnospiraceae bacterium]